MKFVRLHNLKGNHYPVGVSAQVIFVEGKPPVYVAGLAMNDGTPLGIIVKHDQTEFRKWNSFDFLIKQCKALFGPDLTNVNVIPTGQTNDGFVERFMEIFELNVPLDEHNLCLERDRLDLVGLCRGQPSERRKHSPNARRSTTRTGI